jgi:hypothetical protein
MEKTPIYFDAVEETAPETLDGQLAALDDCVDHLLKAMHLARECLFPDIEDAIRADLAIARDYLVFALCAAPDGEPRRRVAALIANIAAKLPSPAFSGGRSRR